MKAVRTVIDSIGVPYILISSLSNYSLSGRGFDFRHFHFGNVSKGITSEEDVTGFIISFHKHFFVFAPFVLSLFIIKNKHFSIFQKYTFHLFYYTKIV